jgi:probable addiction module antidote protein
MMTKSMTKTAAKKINVADLPTFEVSNYLRDDEEMALYLSAMLEDGTPAEIAGALGDIAKARGMAKLAEDTGLSRESLYKGLSGERVPSADTLLRVIRGLGMKLTVQTTAHRRIQIRSATLNN